MCGIYIKKYIRFCRVGSLVEGFLADVRYRDQRKHLPWYHTIDSLNRILAPTRWSGVSIGAVVLDQEKLSPLNIPFPSKHLPHANVCKHSPVMLYFAATESIACSAGRRGGRAGSQKRTWTKACTKNLYGFYTVDIWIKRECKPRRNRHRWLRCRRSRHHHFHHRLTTRQCPPTRSPHLAPWWEKDVLAGSWIFLSRRWRYERDLRCTKLEDY